MHSEIIAWKERIKKSFRGNGVPYNMHCNKTAFVKVGSANKQGKNCHYQVYVENCKYIDTKSH